MEPNEIRGLHHLLTHSPLHFIRYFFPQREGSKFQVSAHHRLIARALTDVLEGRISRLIINVPPGYTKTEMAVINFVAMGLARNHRSRFLHLSYSDTLASLNSSAAKAIVQSPRFQELWPLKLRPDLQSKSLWHTLNGGGLYAVASGGQVTGFRAGLMAQDADGPFQFSGALIVDDPLKPDDAKSTTLLDASNARFVETIRTRLALETTPLIIIMQRLHSEDLSGFLLKGGSGEKWHHLLLRANTLEDRQYPREFTHGIEIKHNLPPGPLWLTKHNAEQLRRIEIATPYTYAGQYNQEPRFIGQTLFNELWWQYYNPVATPIFEWMAIYCDTAQKVKVQHDYSVFQLWGYAKGCIYLVDQMRGKWEAPDLRQALSNFVSKHYRTNVTHSSIRYIKIEDKASGTGLIQDLSRSLPVPILPIPRTVDKLTRAMDAAPFLESKRVFLPQGKDFVLDFVREFSDFRADDTHLHDDQVDPTLDAIQDMLQEGMQIGTWKW